MSVFRNTIMEIGYLPKGYRKTAYLLAETTTGSYIDLNTTYMNKTIKLDIAPTLYSQNWVTLACSTNGATQFRGGINSESIAPNMKLIIVVNASASQSSQFSNYNNKRAIYSITTKTGNCKTEIENTSYSISSTNSNTTTGNLRLYASNANSDRYRGKIYGTKVYDENDTLIYDLVPCYNEETREGCMYDLINKEIYYSKTVEPFKYDGYQPAPEPVIPYTKLEYIESTGTQYINTGYYGTNKTDWEIDMMALSPYVNAYEHYLSATTQSILPKIYLDTYNNANKVSVQSGNNKNVVVNNFYGGSRGIIKTSGTTVYFNGSSIGTGTSRSSGTTSTAIYLFSHNGSYTSRMRLYSFKIYESNVLVKDFIPVLDDNNIPCLYEKKSKTLIYNSGTGDFNYQILS